MDRLKHYFTKKHMLALAGLTVVVLVFWVYSIALVNAPSSDVDSGSFEPINAETPRTLEESETNDQDASNDLPAASASEPYIYNSTEVTSISLLVNKSYRLPSDYVPANMIVPDIPTENKTQSELSMRPETANALESLFAAAEADGITTMLLASAYRSYATQNQLFINAGGDGNTLVAPPGASEHQTGLAADIRGANGACRLEACFGDEPEGEWLADNAHEYGFIIRYPADRSAGTGYSYEPWHLRYVGTELATRLFDENLILEDIN